VLLPCQVSPLPKQSAALLLWAPTLQSATARRSKLCTNILFYLVGCIHAKIRNIAAFSAAVSEQAHTSWAALGGPTLVEQFNFLRRKRAMN
jgi:hypothetical protein